MLIDIPGWPLYPELKQKQPCMIDIVNLRKFCLVGHTLTTMHTFQHLLVECLRRYAYTGYF